MSRRNQRLLVRVLLAAAVAGMIVYRYTSPRSMLRPVEVHDTRR